MLTKTTIAVFIATASMSAQAAPVALSGGNFTMYDPTGAIVGVDNTVSGFVDWSAGTFGVSSSTPFFGLPWTASGGTLFGPGSYSISTADPAPGVSGGTYNVTVGAGQMGGHIDFAWGSTTGIDVVQVWNMALNEYGSMSLISTDIDGDGIPGLRMIEGPFPGFSANFNLCMPNLAGGGCDYVPASIPEASTYAMMLAGLGLVGLMTRRRKQIETHVR